MFGRIIHSKKREVVEQNLDYLVRFAYFRIGNREDAEDIVQEAVVRFLENDRNSINPDNYRMYLFRIVYNFCCDFSRMSVSNLSLETLDISIDPVESAFDTNEYERITKILEILPKRESEVIMMNLIDELKFVEISRILSVPESTVKSRFKSGVERLRKIFNSQDYKYGKL